MEKKLSQFWNNCTKSQKYTILAIGYIIGAAIYIATPSPFDLIPLCFGAYCGYAFGRVMGGTW